MPPFYAQKLFHPASKIVYGHFFSMLLFVLLGGLFLWLPGWGSYWMKVGVGALTLGICVLLPDRRWIINGGILPWLALLFMAAVLISTLLHYLALNRLDPGAYITAGRGTAYWGEGLLIRQTAVYLLFPVLLLISIAIFQNTESGIGCLQLLPLLLLPSLGVALYQAHVDFSFLNDSARIWTDRVPGLGSDVNGFGISLFLLFSATLTALMLSSGRAMKVIYGFVLFLICWALFASGSRTAFGGILLMTLLIFPVRRWVLGRGIPGGRRLHRSLAAIAVALALAGGLFFIRGGSLQDIPLVNRLQHSYQLVKKSGDPKRFSTRWELGLQAGRMIKRSPWAGWGPGGFWRQVDNIRTKYGERRGYIDNAENLYLQVAAELGLPALAAMLLFFLLPVYAAVSVNQKNADPRQRLAAGMLTGTVLVMMVLCITGPHTFSPEVAWITSVMLGYLFSFGLKYGWKPFAKIRRPLLIAAFVLPSAALCAGAYAASLGSRGYTALQHAPWWPLKSEYGLYLPYKNWGPPHGKMVWTSEKSSTRIIMRHNTLSFKVVVYGANAIGPQPLAVTLSVDGKLLDRIYFSDAGSRQLTYFLPGPRGREIFFETQVSRSFIPKEMGMGSDGRVLGVALSPIRLGKNISD